MNILPSAIFQEFQARGLIAEHRGGDRPIRRIAPIEECAAGDLVFVDHAKYLPRVRQQPPSAVVAPAAIADELGDIEGLAVLVAPNVRLAIALLKQAYADRDVRDSEWPRIHPNAVIHDSVAVPEDALIGPGVVVGKDVELGGRVVLMANVVIERGAKIGANTVLHPGCTVGYNCEIGSDVILKAGCVIGSEGFGFAQDEKRRNHRIPHTGKVIVEDRVVIGANTNIDRATYGATLIRAGAVIDAMCHIGHNVEIGEDCILCAHTGISGSTKFGKRVIASGQTGTLDHITVADDVVLLHRAGLNSSIKQPGMYAGGPAQPLQQYLKNMAVAARLHEVWSRLKAVEKKLAELTKP
ncbi:UDP-3-O-[3-hydroxymyristoyl] glucosamine N-acyltransferase [Methylomagnum ishizawai]|uniref:UDP-3-O-acylglucosamine N-acyltransferase n=1 Tax=Methylomagnum ishizawai TaxID=1760988 RepID=A0A1Y6D989_9GAMM|nr:UDP-3-O-(3-hydroxymyristoyl)glucosamine N-acyltransferase [Methylomagnum ishizawai]SMF96962.1 UDP-3-O-[3-hydroxymyristoyl] glucosamine N-acyltransferase [Methylomagnum ishizawai]